MKIEKTLTKEQVKHLPNCNPNWEKVYKYAKLMESGIEFPPVYIYRNEFGRYCYNDGRHRVMAAKLLGKELKIRIYSK